MRRFGKAPITGQVYNDGTGDILSQARDSINAAVQAAAKAARPGQYICCDIYGRYLETKSYLTNGLGIIYRVQGDGSLARYHF